MTVSWSTAGFAEVAALVRERTGLVFPEGRVRDVEATIRRTMARRGIGHLADLIARLRDDDREREAFVADLTIGESYFQRDPAQWDLLRERILPELLAARPRERPIRVWSAGCAAGEEPYTVAMLFEELGAADRSDIVGTDIARARLAEAQRGLYSKWQLRATKEPVRRKYFAEHGRYFELSPRIRRRVDFRYLNLAEDSFPSLSTGIWGMDVILCRNVLIYFDPPTIARVAGRLIASLSEDGWLLLGASDPSIVELVDCAAVLTDAGLVYRRKGVGGPADLRATPEPSWQPSSDEGAGPANGIVAGLIRDRTADEPAESPVGEGTHAHPAAATSRDGDRRAEAGAAGSAQARQHDAAILEAYARRDFSTVQQLAEPASRTRSMSRAAWTAWVRALANEGRLDEAAAALDRALHSESATAELLYLQAVLLLQSGRSADAAATARRALYLDRNLVVAHLTLAEAQRRSGSMEGAQRALRNAEVLLRRLDAGMEVPASDGETAGRLIELVRVKLKLLDGAAGGASK
jgi:chemotaxis protein methyltransferase CheR